MHFVDTENCKTKEIENYLLKKKENYLKNLAKNEKENLENKLSGKNKKEKKTTLSGWANKIIQEPLSKCFKENCGYCGKQVLYNKTKYENENEGDVEHYIPKLKNNLLAFEWSNYIWSCKTCNQILKRDFFNYTYPLLNPTKEADCKCLQYEKGRYTIIEEIKDYDIYKKRLETTEKDTRINYNTNIDQRKALYNSIDIRIESISRVQKELIFKDILEQKRVNELENSYQEKIKELKDSLKYASYKFLIKEVFVEEFKEKYPDFVFDWDKYL